MRIDSHQHFWKFDPVRDAWITADMAVLRRDFLPGDLQPELAANGIDATIAVQADQSEAETEFLVDLASRHKFIAGVVGWVDLRARNLEERLAHWSERGRVVGFRHIAQAEPDDHFLASPDFAAGVARLRPFGFTYDLLVYPRQLPAAIELASRLPDQPFVLDHIAKPPIRSREMGSWCDRLRELAQNPNVYCKLSGIVTEADWKQWTAGHCKPYLDVVFEAFGTERLMFGSDWPVCLLAGSYERVLGLVGDYVLTHALAASAKIFGENALRFYGVNKAAWTCN
jgi:L-fuconolactonase